MCIRDSIRLDRQQHNAVILAKWLKEHPKVEEVYYPGIGAMISFRLRSAESIAQVLEKVRIISFAESLGGVESLITYPLLQTHSDVPEETRLRLGIDDRLLRLSVGIEHITDLCADLNQAF